MSLNGQTTSPPFNPTVTNPSNTFDNVALIGATLIPSTTDFLYLNGYSNKGDGGVAQYYVDGSTGPGTGLVQSGDGRWFRISKPVGDYNVRQFGATGNGATDDTTAIQNAITYVAANGGGNLRIPSGTYIISGAGLSLPANVNLIGEHKNTSILKTTANINILSVVNVSTYGTQIKNLQFLGPNTATGTGLLVNATTQLDAHMLIEDCSFQNLSVGLQHSVGGFGIFDSALIKCDFFTCGVGAYFGGSQNTVVGCTFRVCTYGCQIDNQAAGSVAGIRFFCGTWIQNSYDVVFNGTLIRPCLFSGCWMEQASTSIFGTLTAGTQFHQSTIAQGCMFQPGATAATNGVFNLNNISGNWTFDGCITDQGLLNTATLPAASDARFAASNCIYRRCGCSINSSGGVVSSLSDAYGNQAINFQPLYTNKKYATDAAAGTAGLVQGDLYYNTTSNALSLKN